MPLYEISYKVRELILNAVADNVRDEEFTAIRAALQGPNLGNQTRDRALAALNAAMTSAFRVGDRFEDADLLHYFQDGLLGWNDMTDGQLAGELHKLNVAFEVVREDTPRLDLDGELQLWNHHIAGQG